MKPRFNTTGPCYADEHYMLPPERRLGRIMELIDDGRYFTLHAGRQTGKTTSAQWLIRHYNSGEQFSAIWVDLQTARDESNPEVAFVTVLNNVDDALARSFPGMPRPEERDQWLGDPRTCLARYIRWIVSRVKRPLVVVFDEVDCLVGKTMVTFLTQLRDGYVSRRDLPFAHSVVLVGQRNVRDYTLSQSERNAVAWLGSASPFNIMAEATTLAAFTEAEVAELLSQHTTKTGQPFEAEAVAKVVYLTEGHPWLVNALADQVVDRDVRDRRVPITAAHIEAAKETIIVERRTHIDSLIHKLHDPRVKKLLDVMLAGELIPGGLASDDVDYTLGLGIIRRHRGEFAIANPIYREIIPRALTWNQQHSLHQPTEWYVRADGSLDLPKLMTAWQEFWRKDGHLAAEGFSYREAGPHLMLMAFLQRIVNGGGRIEREYGLGRGALDLMIFWQGERHAIEVKLRRHSETEADALKQVSGYLDRAGLTEGWLILFDLRSSLPWEERLTQRTVEVLGKSVRIVGC
ncbi:MAG: AAA-like domain-containing protein [Polyangiaceae bacterium]|nr:AAA-like domain-containing protein [Polyangiaceae bacterium]